MTEHVVGGKLRAIMNRLEKVINLVCVVFLTCQVIAIIVMVFGRYLFSYVPRATEEFSLFCMVWFSLLSISLSIRDDSHIKMEIMDALVARDKLKYFQYFAAIMTLIFSVYMLFYGYRLVGLTSSSKMAGLLISEGWLYLSVPVSGLLMALASLVFFMEQILEHRHGR